MALGWSRILGGELGEAAGNFLLSFSVEEIALFLSVWAIYLLDRLYDTRRNRGIDDLPLRHRFARSHPRILLGFLLFAVVLLLLLTPCFTFGTWLLGLVVGSGVAAYFFFFRFRAALVRGEEPAWGHRIPDKEIAISLFFVAGVWGASGISLSRQPLATLAGISLFFLVLANCLLIASVEREYDRLCDPASYASRDSISALHLIPGLLITASITAIASVFLSGNMAVSASLLFSAAVLFILRDHRIPGSLVPPLADAALVTPWLFLLGEALSPTG